MHFNQKDIELGEEEEEEEQVQKKQTHTTHRQSAVVFWRGRGENYGVLCGQFHYYHNWQIESFCVATALEQFHRDNSAERGREGAPILNEM